MFIVQVNWSYLKFSIRVLYNNQCDNRDYKDHLQGSHLISSIGCLSYDRKHPSRSSRSFFQVVDHVVESEVVHRKCIGICQIFDPPQVKFSQILVSLEVATLAAICRRCIDSDSNDTSSLNNSNKIEIIW